MVIFAKAPVPGRVKTRLASDIGPAAAAALQEALILDTAEVVIGAAASVAPAPALACAFAEAEDEPILRSMLPDAFRMVPQGSGDLGARLDRVLHRLLRRGPGCVALGVDCPDLLPRHVSAAVGALGRADAVLGPAADGGCWAIGLARPLPSPFSGIPWSTGAVHAALRERLAARGASVIELEPLRDVDRRDDLVRWGSRPAQGWRRTREWWRSAAASRAAGVRRDAPRGTPG